MSRFRRAAHSVISGYVLLAVTAVYALATLPLALHYLSRERFALWGLMSSIGSYLSLIDLGMSGSVARLLIDHKDDRAGGIYGSLIKTGWLVLAVQGAIIFVVGFGLAPLLSNLLAIHPTLQTPTLQMEFISLTRWQTVVLALSFALRIFSHLLQAHQRIDIINYSQIVTLVINFGLLWWFFHAGQGVFSLVWAALISSICGALMVLGACLALRVFPVAGAWGSPSWLLFKELFAYGKDMFLVAAGTQLIMASQTMIITRRLGLGPSGAWFAATRTFNLISQAVWRFCDVSLPAFSEMIVRGERALLRERYKDVLILTASVSAFAAVAFALSNSLFITAYTGWTRHPIDWPPINDTLLGVWMIVMAILHCHNGLVLQTKRAGFMRYIYFIEGVVFVAAALLTAKWGGLPAVIICSIVCSTAFSGAYGVWRVSLYFDLPVREVGLSWLAPMGRVLALFVPAAMVTWWLFKGVNEPLKRLAINGLVTGTLGLCVLLRFGLSRSLQRELLERAPTAIRPLLKWVFGGGGQ